MARILYAWELGANYGHLMRCAHLERALRERGHELVCAVRDTRAAAELLTPRGIAFMQAPRPIRPARLKRPPANYAELLQGEGYVDALTLQGLIGGWMTLLEMSRADVVLADYAPTALLAARAGGTTALAIGNGFAVPPDVFPWPSIRPWEDIPATRLEQAHAAVDAVIAAALQALGQPALLGQELFGADALLDTFAELDHYGARASENYIGPIFAAAPDKAEGPRWKTPERRKVLAYLRPDVPGFAAIMAVLRAADVETVAVVPGLPVKEAKRLAGPHLGIAVRTIALQDLLESADAVLSYGSSGFVTESLLAGKPLLLQPHSVEHYLIARRAESLGAGELIGPDIAPESIAAKLEQVFDEPAFAECARAFAARHADWRPEHALRRVVAALENYLIIHSSTSA